MSRAVVGGEPANRKGNYQVRESFPIRGQTCGWYKDGTNADRLRGDGVQ